MSRHLTKGGAYRFIQLSGAEGTLNLLEQGYIAAFKKGYSVVEIARIGGMKSAKDIHATLVRHGQIGRGKSGRVPKKVAISEALAAQLETRGLSFAQWCAGWGLDQEVAAGDLVSAKGPTLECVRRDFPSYYSILTGAKVGSFVSPPPFVRTDFVVKFDWDGIKNSYRAEINELNLCGYGDSYHTALRSVLTQRWYQSILSRLGDLPCLTK